MVPYVTNNAILQRILNKLHLHMPTNRNNTQKYKKALYIALKWKTTAYQTVTLVGVYGIF